MLFCKYLLNTIFSHCIHANCARIYWFIVTFKSLKISKNLVLTSIFAKFFPTIHRVFIIFWYILAKSSEFISFTMFYRQKPKLQRNISTLSKSSVSRRDKHFHTCFDIFSNFCQKCLNKSCVILQILVEYHLFTLYNTQIVQEINDLEWLLKVWKFQKI